MATRRRAPAGLVVPINCPAPAMQEPLYPKVKITSKTPVEVEIVSRELAAVHYHYVDGRTQLCTEQLGQCWLQPHELFGRRWIGWLLVVLPGKEDPLMTWITKATVASEPRLEDRSRSLRGLTLALRRRKDTEYSELLGAIQTRKRRRRDLPDEPDMEYLVHRMYTARDRKQREEANSQLHAARNNDQVPGGDGHPFDATHLKAMEYLGQLTARSGEVQP